MSSGVIRPEQTTQDASEPRRVALFGGGRWARVLLQELTKVVSVDTQVVWISKNLFAESKSWLSEHHRPNVCLQSDWDSETKSFDAAIIATSVSRHFDLSKRLLEKGLPTLCEKPVALSIDELELLTSISSRSSVPFGIHLEFLFSTPIREMSKLLSSRLVEEIEVQWQDPWIEERDGQLKTAEMGTDVLNDQFPHVWSIICGLTSIESKLEITSSRISSSHVQVEGFAGNVHINAILGRRANKRIRRVIVNCGEASIDFSCSPCLVNIGSKVIPTAHWEHRTLCSSLTSFLNVSQQCSRNDNQYDAKTWPLSVQTHVEMLAQCIQVAEQMSILRKLEIDRLERLQRIDLDDPEQVALILDCYLPRLAKSGMRLVPVSLQDQVLAAKQIMRDRRDYPPLER